MEYTKGEWKVRQPEVEPQRLVVDCQWKEGEQRYHRSICRTFGHCDTEQEEFANAQLIASAPDMYEALKEVKQMLDTIPHELKDKVIYIQTVDKYEKALAKAEGNR